MDKDKPEHFILMKEVDKLKISWKKGSYNWAINFNKLIVKVISSNKNYIWKEIIFF